MSSERALVRNEKYLKNYQEWVDSTRFREFLGTVRDAFGAAAFKDGHEICDVFRYPTSVIMVVHHANDFAEAELSFFMDYLQQQVLTMDYYNYMSDRRGETMDGGIVVETHRHYLKPRIKPGVAKTELIDRKFGNIILETTFEEQYPVFFKLTCNYYNERNQKKELSFDTLMQELLR